MNFFQFSSSLLLFLCAVSAHPAHGIHNKHQERSAIVERDPVFGGYAGAFLKATAGPFFNQTNAAFVVPSAGGPQFSVLITMIAGHSAGGLVMTVDTNAASHFKAWTPGHQLVSQTIYYNLDSLDIQSGDLIYISVADGTNGSPGALAMRNNKNQKTFSTNFVSSFINPEPGTAEWLIGPNGDWPLLDFGTFEFQDANAICSGTGIKQDLASAKALTLYSLDGKTVLATGSSTPGSVSVTYGS